MAKQWMAWFVVWFFCMAFALALGALAAFEGGAV